MTEAANSKRRVFAVLRIDHYLRDVSDDLTQLVTVKEVLFTMEKADEEADRLNRLVAEAGRSGEVEYFVQHSRLVAEESSGFE